MLERDAAVAAVARGPTADGADRGRGQRLGSSRRDDSAPALARDPGRDAAWRAAGDDQQAGRQGRECDEQHHGHIDPGEGQRFVNRTRSCCRRVRRWRAGGGRCAGLWASLCMRGGGRRRGGRAGSGRCRRSRGWRQSDRRRRRGGGGGGGGGRGRRGGRRGGGCRGRRHRRTALSTEASRDYFSERGGLSGWSGSLGEVDLVVARRKRDLPWRLVHILEEDLWGGSARNVRLGGPAGKVALRWGAAGHDGGVRLGGRETNPHHAAGGDRLTRQRGGARRVRRSRGRRPRGLSGDQQGRRRAERKHNGQTQENRDGPTKPACWHLCHFFAPSPYFTRERSVPHRTGRCPESPAARRPHGGQPASARSSSVMRRAAGSTSTPGPMVELTATDLM
jgi:hypothetical protein